MQGLRDSDCRERGWGTQPLRRFLCVSGSEDPSYTRVALEGRDLEVAARSFLNHKLEEEV